MLRSHNCSLIFQPLHFCLLLENTRLKNNSSKAQCLYLLCFSRLGSTGSWEPLKIISLQFSEEPSASS